ncbi:hypothetical protein ACFSHQ_12510 [Gemmobacter lanyuensis]
MQAGYFIMAARSIGLDCGPMGGFDKAGIADAFFEGATGRPISLSTLVTAIRPRCARGRLGLNSRAWRRWSERCS